MFWLIFLGLIIFLYVSVQIIKKIPFNSRQHQTFKSYFFNLPPDMQRSFLGELDKNTRYLVEYYLKNAEESLEAKPNPLFTKLQSVQSWQADRQLDLELEQEMWQIFTCWAVTKTTKGTKGN